MPLSPPTSSDPAAIAAWNAALNRTHDMAGLRARGGGVVRAVEERRRRLVASRVRRARRPVAGGGAPRVGVVADVGCEDGWIAEAYAARVEETVLVDVDPAMLARAEQKRLPRARCAVGDAAGPAVVPPESADVVVFSAVLEHLARPLDALAAWAPALVPGGRFVVFVPADEPILAAKRVLRAARLSALVPGISLEPAPGHVVTFRRAALARLLNPFGAVEGIAFDPAVLGYVATVRVGGRRGAFARSAGTS